jgi:hypothetical protein
MINTVGKPRVPFAAWASSATLALTISFGAAALIAHFRHPDHFSLAFWVYGSSFLPPAGALMWILLISRHTGETKETHAEQSVETSWLHEAGFGALTDVFLLAGVGSAVLALSKLPLTGTNALMGTAILALVSLCVRYNILRHRHS